jgi:hypothetical protein
VTVKKGGRKKEKKGQRKGGKKLAFFSILKFLNNYTVIIIN